MELLVWIILSIFIGSSLALSPDGATLLELRSAFNDTKNMLKDWEQSDPTPCNWTGITCHPRDKTVSSINLPYMQLSGMISPSIGKLRRLQRLALHQNSLWGIIPTEISNCRELRALYLRANNLQGGIPSELGNVSRLAILDLSGNSLKGAIPASLGHLTQLRFLNLSNNFFFGEIPNLGVLGTFGSNSFSGNTNLCGLQIHKPCRTSIGFPVILPHSEPDGATENSEVQPKRSSHVMDHILIGAIFAMGLLFIMIFSYLLICLCSKKRKLVRKYTKINKQLRQDIGTKLVTFNGDIPYDSQEIVRKLELLGEDDVVGSGGYGTVYKMVMDDTCAFAVKSIDTTREGSDQIFERQLEILGSIKHKNLVSLRAYCCLPSSKVLIYDYFVLGSLDYVLHGEGPKQQFLDWTSRLKIAVGTARGIAYLHHDCCPRIVHQDIKSNNILLNQNLEPHVSDFGLANLLLEDEAHVTTVVAGTFGYLAPEYLHSGRASEKSDVYSFGVLLLELVSGKRPTDPSFVKRGLNIVGWMNTLLMENRLLEIVDKNCKDADAETVEAVLEIAAKCTEADPESRPPMSTVLQMLEEEVSPCLTEFYDTQSDM